jgi:hypothetical protein
MAGRGRLLLTTDSTNEEFDPNPPPVVGRVVLWPLPRQQNAVYPLDTENLPTPRPSRTSVVQSNGRVMAVSPSVRPLVPRPAATAGQTPLEQLAAAAPAPRPVLTANQNRLRPSVLDCPALALEQLELLQRYVIDQEDLRVRYFQKVWDVNARYGEEHY